MKNFIKIVLVLFVAIFSVSCNKKWNREKIEYYLSQPRDPELFGWWKIVDPGFWNLKSSGTITEASFTQSTNDYYIYESRYYWYTEKTNDNRKILHLFEPSGVLEKKYEPSYYYLIRNDSLWITSALDDSDLYFYGTHCEEEPEEVKK